MNAKQLSEILRRAADRLDGGIWDDAAHVELVTAARQSTAYELGGGVSDDPRRMSRARFEELSARDKVAFLKSGGVLFDEAEGGAR